MSSKLLVKAA